MRKLHLLELLIIGYLVTTNLSSAQWQKINTPLVDVPLSTKAVVVKGDTILVGTYRGTIYGSNDGGFTWGLRNNGLSPSLYETYSLLNVSDTVYAATTDGVYVSSDWGFHWVLKNNGFPPLYLVGITAITNFDHITYAVIPNDGVFCTTNSGDSWLPDTVGLPRTIYKIVVPIGSILAKDSMIFIGTSSGIFSKKICDIRWQQINTNRYNNILGSDSHRIFASFGDCTGSFFISNDLGNSWQNFSSGLPKNVSTDCYLPVYSVAVKEDQLVVGTDAGIYSSSDNGQNWKPLNAGIIGDLNRINDNIIAAGNEFYDATFNGLYKLKIGDTAWTPLFKHYPALPSTMYCFGLGQKVLIKTFNDYYNGTIIGTYISSDQGVSWNQDTSKPISSFNHFFQLSNKVLGVGSNLFVSYDYGSHWTKSDSGLPGWGGINALVENGTLMFAGYGSYLLNSDVGGIYRSNDNGKSWALIGLENNPIRSIAIAKGNVFAQRKGIYISYSLFRSTDNGATWACIDSLISNGAYPHKVIDLNDVVYLATNHGVYESTDGGNSWGHNSIGLPKDSSGSYLPVYYMYACPTIQSLSDLIFTVVQNRLYVLKQGHTCWDEIDSGMVLKEKNIYNLTTNNDFLFAATDSGLWRINLFELTTIQDGEKNELPKHFLLLQNYPNPFNPTTTIKFSIPVETLHPASAGQVATSLQHVTLKVYDILGREVSTLVNEDKSPGNYEVKFDGNNLASGVYFYRLHAGLFDETKKFVLMK